MTPAFVGAASALGLLDVWMAPFVSVSNGAPPAKSKLCKRFSHFRASGLPVVPQVLGKDPATVAACVSRLVACGFKFVSLNFACPSREVVGSGAGGALLAKPGVLLEVLKRSLDAASGEASLIVKIRTGWESPREAETLVPSIVEAGAACLICHFRTVQEKYQAVSGGVERLARVVELAGAVPVVGNGDVFSRADAEAMFSGSKCAAVAAARGFMADPFLLQRIKGLPAPSLAEGRAEFLKLVRSWPEAPTPGNVLELVKAMHGQDSAEFARVRKSFSDAV